MKKVLVRTGAVIAGLLVLVLVYGTVVEPRFVVDERRYTAAVPGLPQEWEGAEVAVFSDLQIGMWWANVGMVERIVERTVQEEPDAVLLAGDYVYSTEPDVDVQVRHVVDLLQPLTDAEIPTYAVLGNHDHHVEAADELTTALEDAGIPVLVNEAVALPAPSGASGASDPLYVVGLGATRPGRTDVDQALGGLPEGAPRVVVMHNPTAFPRLPAQSAPLAIAGHTHCGQIVLPGSPRWSYLALTEEEKVVADGWAPPGYGAEGNELFVTCGIGFSLVPVRINAAPQLVVFELVPAG